MHIQEILTTLDVHLLSVGQATVGREWCYRNVNNFYNRLLLVLDGETTVTCSGKKYHLCAGDIHLIPCFASVDYVCPCSFTHYYATFTSRILGGVDICAIQEYELQRKVRSQDHYAMEQVVRLNPTQQLPVNDPALGSYRQYHETQSSIYHQRPIHEHMDNMSYLCLMLSPFLATGSAMNSGPNARRLFTFLLYVEENLHRPVSVQDIADHLDVSPNYLSDWLSRHYRFRPVEYINRRRVEQAQQLLITTRESIQEISYKVGFSSLSYFSRLFKAQTGVAASRYRTLNN